MIWRHTANAVFVGMMLCGCQSERADQHADDHALLELIPTSVTKVLFENAVNETVEYNVGEYDYLYNGGGVAIGDLNNDGLPDLFFTGNSVGNKLYFNKGNFEFEDVTAQSGISGKYWSTGATMADVNNDGLLDIYVSNSGPYWHSLVRKNQLYINQGKGKFIDEAAQRGVNNNGNSIQASFFDYDRDGDLDLFVMNHMSVFTNQGDAFFEQLREMSAVNQREQFNAFYQNNGNGIFEDITARAGMRRTGYGLGLAVSDLNNNGLLDVYVANDYAIPDFYFVNMGDGTFQEKVNLRTGHISYYSMGCDAADINNDGWMDLAVLDMSPGDHKRSKTLMASMKVEDFASLTQEMHFQRQYMVNVLQLNRGGGYFSEMGGMLHVAKTDWSWGALFVDLDNDGWKDYFVTNGYKRDTKNNDYRVKVAEITAKSGGALSPEKYFEMLKEVDQVPIPNFVYKNMGGLEFADYSEQWGMTKKTFSNGAAYGDLDGDGDLDLVINNLDSPADIYRNYAREKGLGNYLQVDLKSANPAEALHAKVSVKAAGEEQFAENASTRGYQSFMEPIVHFGLGEHKKIDELKIDWLDGTTTIVEHPKVNTRIEVVKERGSRTPQKRSSPSPSFGDVTPKLVIDIFRHVENKFDDFAKEILLPHRQSTIGPCLAVGDVNGDLADDFFIGGAAGQAGRLYLQARDATFGTSSSQPWTAHASSEDMGSAFFDYDNDGDLDLYIASGGGGEMLGNEVLLQDRMYENDGFGQFEFVDVLPRIRASGGRVKPCDFDNDGDLDLFICGRTAPGKYPYPGRSYLLRNENGRFADVTDDIAPDLSDIGMVTDAYWEDFDHDNNTDLVVVGEWMPITVLKNNGQTLEVYESTGLEMSSGWWYAIEGADFDGDGDTDFIVGNLGENNKFGPSEESPLHIYANDYDENGTLDIVLSKKYEGHLVPVRGKECSTQQMPFVSDKFQTYASFANASLDDIYTTDKLGEALHYKAYSFSSVYLENKGDFNFVPHTLPKAAQLGPINGIVINDFNKNGKKEVVVAGAMLGSEVETPSYDGNVGLLLTSAGDNEFEPVSLAVESGIYLNRNVKALAPIRIGPGKAPGILVANNDDRMQLLVYLRR
jgi:enediyne biosynthesis protein E4